MKRGNIKRTAMQPRKKRMSPVSKRRKELSVTYAEFKAAYTVAHYRCEFEPLPEYDPQCFEEAVDIHHILPRGRSGRDSDLIDPENVMAVCRKHHDYIEANREWALEVGYLKHARTDEELRNEAD